MWLVLPSPELQVHRRGQPSGLTTPVAVPCAGYGSPWLLGDPHCAPTSSVPGPCEPEDLIDGIIFAANYLGSTQLLSERNPSKNIRMMQAQEAVSRVKVGYFRALGLLGWAPRGSSEMGGVQWGTGAPSGPEKRHGPASQKRPIRPAGKRSSGHSCHWLHKHGLANLCKMILQR